MTKNSYHTEVERAKIVTLHKDGLSQRQIFKQLSISKSPIQRAITKFKNKEFMAIERKVVDPEKQPLEMIPL